MGKINYRRFIFRELIWALIFTSLIVFGFWCMFNSTSNVSSVADSYEFLNDSGSRELGDSVILLENEFKQFKRRAQYKQTNLYKFGGFEGAGLGLVTYGDSTFKNQQKYIVLTDFGLNQNQYDYDNYKRYYYKNGHSYISIPHKAEVAKHTYKISFKDMLVDFRYDAEGNKILLPISNKTALIKILYYLISGLLLLVFVFGFTLFIKLLVSISRNNIFDEINLKRLLWIAFSCLTFVVYPRLISLVIYLFYYKTLSVGVIYTKGFSSFDFSFTLVGILFFAVYIAFKKGYKLKQENDLTI